MQRRNFLLHTATGITGLLLAGCTTTPSGTRSEATDASKRQSIDASVDGTISRLYASVPGARELVSKAQGVLVFPSVLQVGFVVGGQYGEGALRVAERTVGYYSTVSGSFGLTAGAQSKAIIFLFMTEDALQKFRGAKGWSVGTDASVALVKIGANGTIDTSTATAAVDAIVLTNSGLMADVSLSGTKVSPLSI
ncbi:MULTISPECIES: YSC84-related protein [unclassified Paraburkholderia]|uniref:BPSL1445 family SYLF domain-containing lipoprotein n=1 Tax=unclassified Paraburkholderia TaxID=2615204 RepID=UPI000D075AB0|nr:MULTISPECIES: YSC84-related protein [unclassified Paraburkholderia]PRX99335.1 lipid-binding SYLF domain-containing protein [Paraburkholderia sp. BL25I1N1]REE24128.1 lipid-binding SYLF domain-containing protein [Paraburkholderia sp. BL27I4N3]REG49240.1 lipid-binding SYLF domain-containing protein [Paraburkholderia sp. BL6669N2]RKR38259.1 lipid-binding SYLF domain-containing protein [Paraburkholderia sp. BL17N1]TDY19902.1 lipid-binding SYLF domain-containing protein [Paraburkholderia sp. BL66